MVKAGPGPLFTENDKKMIKRDWKLARPSDFTYTSIVQPVLQVYNPFSQFLEQFVVSNASNLKREKSYKNDTKWIDYPYRVYRGTLMG